MGFQQPHPILCSQGVWESRCVCPQSSVKVVAVFPVLFLHVWNGASQIVCLTLLAASNWPRGGTWRET